MSDVAPSSSMPENASLYFRACRLLAASIGVVFCLWHIYVALVGVPEPLFFRGMHLLFGLVLCFLWYTGFSGRQDRAPDVVDWLLIAASILSLAYIYLNYRYVAYQRFATVTDLRTIEWVGGIVLILLVLESTRRVLGLVLPVLAVMFIVGSLAFTRLDAEIIVDQMYLTTEGIFGIPIAVSATYIMLFVMFGTFVEKTRTGQLFMDFSMALTGWAAGGPAKVAVMSSGMMGSISGSAVANIMTTGVFTIPLMRRLGYRRSFSGAVEAVASTGGQIMPPIMGAAAFVMAEFLNTSYLAVITMAIIPAMLYYLAVFMAVHFEAKRMGMRGVPRPDLPRLGRVLKERGHQFLPLVVIVGVLLAGYSATYAALWGIASVFPTALLRKSTRDVFNFHTIIDALVMTARNTLLIITACATAGIVIGMVNLGGLGVEFTGLIVTMSQNNLVLALVLTAMAGIVLGMGLPTTPAYIIQTALLVPALVRLGVDREAAHFFVLYYAILSVITPPVAIGVFAANMISGAKLWETGWAAIKLAATGYIIPFMFVFGPALLLIGPWQQVTIAVMTAMVGVICLASSLHAYLFIKTRWWERILLFSAALVLIRPGIESDIAGILLVGSTLLSQYLRRNSPDAIPPDAPMPAWDTGAGPLIPISTPTLAEEVAAGEISKSALPEGDAAALRGAPPHPAPGRG